MTSKTILWISLWFFGLVLSAAVCFSLLYIISQNAAESGFHYSLSHSGTYLLLCLEPGLPEIFYIWIPCRKQSKQTSSAFPTFSCACNFVNCTCYSHVFIILKCDSSFRFFLRNDNMQYSSCAKYVILLFNIWYMLCLCVCIHTHRKQTAVSTSR